MSPYDAQTEYERRAGELFRALQDAADMRRERDSLETENQRLREALEEIATFRVLTNAERWKIAREALAGDTE